MSAALLVMDFQAGVVDRFSGSETVSRARRAVDAARAHGVPAVFVRIGFREGNPEVSGRNKSFAAVAGRAEMGEDAPGTQVVAELAPEPGEVTVVKRRVSAFAGSDLGVVLRSADVDHRVLTEKVFPRQADVLSVDEWVAGLG